jgi:hypothetical protein
LNFIGTKVGKNQRLPCVKQLGLHSPIPYFSILTILTMKRIIGFLFLIGGFALHAQDGSGYQTPPDAITQLVDAPLTPTVLFSPDKSVMVMLDRSDLPSIEELSRPELRIAGLRINPDNFGQSRNNFFIGMKVKKLSDKKDYSISGLPENIQMSSPGFSPDSKKFSFVQTYPDRLELWVVDLTTFSARKISSKKVNSTMANPYAWLSNSNTLIYLAVANEAKQAPVKTRVPAGPVIEENLGKKAPSRTYQDLLKNPYDESLFDFYCTSQLTTVSWMELRKPLVTQAFTSHSVHHQTANCS